MKTAALIPARGGSRRLPRKNIRSVAGKPALHYPVAAALESGLFDRILVSTEDEEIKETALDCRAEVMDRPENLSGDRVRVTEVCLDVLDRLEEQGFLPDHFCCIYPTAVFIRPSDLVESFGLVKDGTGVNGVMAVSSFNLSPVQALEVRQGYLTPRWPEHVMLRGQDQPVFVASSGMFYWMETQAFLEQKTFYPDRLKGYEIPRIRAVDLNTPADLEIVEMLAPSLLSMR